MKKIEKKNNFQVHNLEISCIMNFNLKKDFFNKTHDDDGDGYDSDASINDGAGGYVTDDDGDDDLDPY